MVGQSSRDEAYWYLQIEIVTFDLDPQRQETRSGTSIHVDGEDCTDN